ncbi:MAG: DUF4864 domain-containing protein [Rhodospirillales bacterium]
MMSIRMQLIPAFFVLGLIFSATPALADRTLSAGDQSAIRAVIQSQLAAFQIDDANTAYGHASTAIQLRFGSPAEFMSMVRTHYRPVYRPAAYQFLDLAVESGGIFQPVAITTQSGDTVIALYRMEKDETGRWRIAGCRLIDPPGAGA